MISESQLNDAIAEMQGQRRPDANTCLKLASYYTIRNELFPRSTPQIDRQYSNAPEPAAVTIDYESGTDFGELVNGQKVDDVMRKIDRVMGDLYAIDPPLYRKILRELA